MPTVSLVDSIIYSLNTGKLATEKIMTTMISTNALTSVCGAVGTLWNKDVYFNTVEDINPGFTVEESGVEGPCVCTYL